MKADDKGQRGQFQVQPCGVQTGHTIARTADSAALQAAPSPFGDTGKIASRPSPMNLSTSPPNGWIAPTSRALQSLSAMINWLELSVSDSRVKSRKSETHTTASITSPVPPRLEPHYQKSAAPLGISHDRRPPIAVPYPAFGRDLRSVLCAACGFVQSSASGRRGPSVKGAEDVVASDDSEKAYLEAYAVARQAGDAVDGLVGKLNSAASNFDRGRWKRF